MTETRTVKAWWYEHECQAAEAVEESPWDGMDLAEPEPVGPVPWIEFQRGRADNTRRPCTPFGCDGFALLCTHHQAMRRARQGETST